MRVWSMSSCGCDLENTSSSVHLISPLICRRTAHTPHPHTSPGSRRTRRSVDHQAQQATRAMVREHTFFPLAPHSFSSHSLASLQRLPSSPTLLLTRSSLWLFCCVPAQTPSEAQDQYESMRPEIGMHFEVAVDSFVVLVCVGALICVPLAPPRVREHLFFFALVCKWLVLFSCAAAR